MAGIRNWGRGRERGERGEQRGEGVEVSAVVERPKPARGDPMGFNTAVLLAEVERAMAELEVSRAELPQLDPSRDEQVVENGARGAEGERSDRRRSQDKVRSWQ
jgi:hypothetical protein